MSAPDRLVLGMWKTFENIRHISTSSIIIHWSPSGSVSNRAFDGIAALDSSKVLTTCTSFPIRRKIDHVEDGNEIVKDGKEGREGDDEKVYDPIFVLSLLATMMSDDTLTGLDWVEILRSNSLGLAICALSSRDEGMRDLSGYVLSQTIEYIKVSSKSPYRLNMARELINKRINHSMKEINYNTHYSSFDMPSSPIHQIQG